MKKAALNKSWDGVNISKLEDRVKIKFTENIANTSIKKGDIKMVTSFSVWHVDENVCMSFDNSGNKCYDIPYKTFIVL